MIRKIALCALAAASLAAPAAAFLGFGTIVYDPSNYWQALQRLAQLERQYAQLVETYRVVRSQYEHMRRMAQPVPAARAWRYRAQAAPWRPAAAADALGASGGWIRGVNTGLGAAAGYAGATEELLAFGEALAAVPAGQLGRLKAEYATVELTDGANVHGIETVGRLRANAPFVADAIRGLEDDALSADPALNTHIAVLNKINAAGVAALRSGQDANQLLVALVERGMVEAKRTRDAEARAFNHHIRYLREGRAAMAAQAAGASEAMLAWRMP